MLEARAFRWERARSGGGIRALLGQLVRFGVVGCSNTALSWCVYALLVRSGMHVLFASAVAWTFGALNSFVLNRRWTFRSRGRWTPELLRFAAVQCAGLVMNLLLLEALTRDAGVHPLVAQALVYPVTTLATFALSRQWAFSGYGRAGRWPA